MQQKSGSGGLRAFLIIWLGQLISLIGSQLTGFALGVWVYDQTHSILFLALTQIANQAPYVLVSPLAGVLADRWNRRTAMLVSDFGSGLAVLAAAGLYLSHTLQPWMVIPINLWMAVFNSLMWPAYAASLTQLIPKEHFGRANGLMQLGEAIPQIAGPAIAGRGPSPAGTWACSPSKTFLSVPLPRTSGRACRIRLQYNRPGKRQ